MCFRDGVECGNAWAKAEPLEILLVGDPRLEQVSARVERVDDDLRVAAARMHATLDAFRARTGYGRGLAAPQVGVMQRVVVMNMREHAAGGSGRGTVHSGESGNDVAKRRVV